ncbi:uncharacterized protein LOC142644211 [Castanea sativa]|uniref:uncharacterized protein LOC142644211 n=1 Tax=Castanea sativa TaxID=21020 RepID=UPI003F650B6A
MTHHLTMSDMATLAIKVSVALQSASSKDGHRCKKACILVVNKSVGQEVAKMAVCSFRRAKMAVCSFRHRLSTIYEGTTL